MAVHPRRRGEHVRKAGRQRRKYGSSLQARGTPICRQTDAGYATVHPRRRGEHRTYRPNPNHTVGSSPQARGTLVHDVAADDGRRFIPAGAGNTGQGIDSVVVMTVHPRRRGEHAEKSAGTWGVVGSSPQARGTPKLYTATMSRCRFIPAGAGNTQALHRNYEQMPVHPRRRGEHRLRGFLRVAFFGSSPQARGTPPDRVRVRGGRRFIPAGAGNTGLELG